MSKIEKLLPVNIRQFEEQEPVNETPEEDFSKYIQGDSLDVEGLIRDFAEDTSPSKSVGIDMTDRGLINIDKQCSEN